MISSVLRRHYNGEFANDGKHWNVFQDKDGAHYLPQNCVRCECDVFRYKRDTQTCADCGLVMRPEG